MRPSTQLGPYRVDSLIGAGGMGEVYLGIDTRLDRQVAIKVLPRELSENTSLRERLEREARTISSLNHPNICTLFDIGKHEGRDYLVMEYLQGETLADRIVRGPMRSDEVVRVGTEIANALDRAHHQGIVHRDLKPGNIMLTKSGVKLLDFGLAKITLQQKDANARSVMATEQKPLTEQGAILGTFQYMSPEQLEGKEADARSDIFALGAILYEMSTSQRAFTGTSKASLIASIMDRDPRPMSEIQPMTPRSLERLVRACLMKDPDERIETAHDVALQLRWISESSSAIEGPVVRKRKKLAPWVVTGAVAFAAAGAAAMYMRERAKPAPPLSLSILPPKNFEFRSMGLSPDGSTLAFVANPRSGGDSSLWIRRLDDGTERQVATKVGANYPFWSPDGRSVAFLREPGILSRIGREGGEPETICRTSMQGSGAWTADGTIVFCPRFGTGLSSVSANGGDPKVLTKLDAARHETYHGDPTFLSDGRHFVYIVHTISEKRNEIWSSTIDGGQPHLVVAADSVVGYTKPWLLYGRDGAIYAHRLNERKQTVEGEPVRVVDNAYFTEQDAASAAKVAGNGALVYYRFTPSRLLYNTYDRKGNVLSTLWEDDDIGNVRIAPDQKSLLYAKWNPSKGANDLYSVELSRKIATRLTGGLSANNLCEMTPDGQSIIFQTDRGGMFDLYMKTIDGTSPEKPLWVDERDKQIMSISGDGKYALTGRYTQETRFDIWLFPLNSTEKPQLLISTEAADDSASFSPDGRWIAYRSEQSGASEIYVKGFPTGKAVRVSTDGGFSPSWSYDSRELIWSSRGHVMTASIRGAGGAADVGAPQELFFLPRMWTRPQFMKDGRIALGIPAPNEDAISVLDYTTAWRSKLH